jgi:hypothetical protein
MALDGSVQAATLVFKRTHKYQRIEQTRKLRIGSLSPQFGVKAPLPQRNRPDQRIVQGGYVWAWPPSNYLLEHLATKAFIVFTR